jgi:hypothetical protein
MDIDTKERVAEIRRSNEQFRLTFCGAKIRLTASVAELPDIVKAPHLRRSPRSTTSMKGTTRTKKGITGRSIITESSGSNRLLRF